MPPASFSLRSEAQRTEAPYTFHFFARRGLVWDKARLGALGWAGKKSGIFEHPAKKFCSCPRHVGHRIFVMPKWFFRSLLNSTSCFTECEQATALHGK
jgi:hypothetical protein